VSQCPPIAVSLQDVYVVRGRTEILCGATCEIPAGAYTALLGPNGCGKTTLTRTLTGQMYVTSGEVRVLGETLGQTDMRALRRRIGVVNPTTDMAGAHMAGAVVDADLSALAAVLTGFFGSIGLYETPTAEQRQQALAALTRVGLQERATLRYGLLSTGEQRRCLIARALVQEPRLLILDEPTAGLDLAGREQVLATVEDLLSCPRPPTILFITHHVEELSPRTCHVLLMKQGRIVRAGPPPEVLTSGNLTHLFGCNVRLRRAHGRWWPQVAPRTFPTLPVR